VFWVEEWCFYYVDGVFDWCFYVFWVGVVLCDDVVEVVVEIDVWINCVVCDLVVEFV